MSDSGRRRVGPGARFAALLVLAAALLLAALPAAASAGPFSSNGSEPSVSVPGNQSAGDQYVETLPTTKGPRAPGRNKHARKLSQDITKKIHHLGGSDAAALKKLATSTALGAPAVAGTNEGGDKGSDGNASPGKRSHAGRSGKGKRHGSAPAVPSAAINAVDEGEAGLGWLVLAILAITALALGAVGYQRRRDKGSAS